MQFRQKLSNFLKTVFPSTLTEIFVFITFLVIYGSLAYTIASEYRIVFDDRIPWDAYFSFDNRAIVMTGGGYERHPLANFYFDWIREFALLISGGQKNDTFRIVLSFCSTAAISLGLVQIYKYLKNIIGLPNKISFLILFFFAGFSTNILLSFTPETYTYTLLLLILFNYYAALKLRNEERISPAALTLAATFIGGLTITNILKVYIPLLFERNIFKTWRTVGNSIARAAVSVGVFVLLFLYRMDFKSFDFLKKTSDQYEKFSTARTTPFWDMVVSWFFGGNILFPGFELRNYHSMSGFKFKAIFMEVYTTWASYFVVGMVIFLILFSYILNFKNRLVQILLLSFLIDILIHVILKFGLHTAYIYGGHFVFVYPLLLGWLFHHYKNSPQKMTALYAILSLLTVYIITNNIFRMEEFFVFLDAYYR